MNNNNTCSTDVEKKWFQWCKNMLGEYKNVVLQKAYQSGISSPSQSRERSIAFEKTYGSPRTINKAD